jgi:paraquat-inducible protein B
MDKRVSPAAIGAFVLAGIALAVVATVILGSGELLQNHYDYICMFQDNLTGLKVGAPVKVRGVQIGRVKEISLWLHEGQGELRQISIADQPLPVIIELDERELRASGGGPAFMREFRPIGARSLALNQAVIDELVKMGLRARLSMENLLTGVIYVDFEFHPGTPLNFYLVHGSGPYPEIPTIPTQWEQIREGATKALAKLGEVDFKRLADSITEAG